MGCSSSAAEGSTFQDEFQLGDKLGEGAFGQVWEVSATERRRARGGAQHSKNQDCVVKIIGLREDNGASLTSREKAKRSSRIMAAITNEVSVHDVVGAHPNILHMVARFTTASHCYLVMERRRCSLVSFIEKEAPANEGEMARLFRQMLFALAHVHSNGVVHGNVQPRSFVVGGQDGRTLKLTDFSVSTKLSDFSLIAGGDLVLKGNRGAREFAAPEVLKGECYGSTADIWSFGVTAYLMLYGEHPYLPLGPTERAALGFEGLLVAKQQSGSARFMAWEPSRLSENFLKVILTHDPELRPSARSCLAMPLLDLPRVDGSRARKHELLASSLLAVEQARKMKALSQAV